MAILIAAPVFADSVTAFKYTGSAPGHPENVEADFIVVGGNLQITLTNIVSSMTYDTQILTGVSFTWADEGSTAGTVTNPVVPTYNINDTGGVITPTGVNANAGWITSLTALSGYVTLTTIGAPGHSAGNYGIISTSTNTSGTNNLSQHGPFIEGPVQFTIAGLGVTASSQITGVQFNFGTILGSYSGVVTSTVSTSTPEPGTIALSSIALVGLLWAVRKRQRTV